MPRLPKENPLHGKKPNQKLKPYLVLQYLMLNSDESHTISAEKIAEALQNYGIDAERRSIYKDIEEINKAQLIITQNVDVWDAEDMLADDIDDEIKLVAYLCALAVSFRLIRSHSYLVLLATTLTCRLYLFLTSIIIHLILCIFNSQYAQSLVMICVEIVHLTLCMCCSIMETVEKEVFIKCLLFTKNCSPF